MGGQLRLPGDTAGAASIDDFKDLRHERGIPLHPQTQSEHWHQTLKNHILFENDFLPGTSNPRSKTSRIGYLGLLELDDAAMLAGPCPSNRQQLRSTVGDSAGDLLGRNQQSAFDPCQYVWRPPL